MFALCARKLDLNEKWVPQGVLDLGWHGNGKRATFQNNRNQFIQFKMNINHEVNIGLAMKCTFLSITSKNWKYNQNKMEKSIKQPLVLIGI